MTFIGDLIAKILTFVLQILNMLFGTTLSVVNNVAV